MKSPQYDKIGPEYVALQGKFYAQVGKDEPTEFIAKAIADEAKNPMRCLDILDLGCGDGQRCLCFAGGGKHRVFGLDESEFMVSQARKLGFYDEVVRASMDSIPREGIGCDVVTARYSLLVVKDVDKVYEEVNRVLRPGGLFVAVVAHPLEGLLRQKEKTYGKTERIEVPLFEGKVVVRDYSHTFAEYFSPKFLKHFTLERLEEGKQQDAILPDTEIKFPGFLGFAGRKR